MPRDGWMSSGELQRRLMHALFMPSARFAQAFGVPLNELGKRMQVAYFHLLRTQGLRLREVCEALGISPSLAANLSKRLKESFADEDSAALGRRIEFMLWAEPLSEARLCQVLTDVEADEIRAALEALEAEGRITQVKGRTMTYAIARASSRIVRDRILSRLDGLSNLLEAISNAVYGRFISDDPDAFARVLTLRVREADMDALRQLYEETIWPALEALDAAAKGDASARSMEFVVSWAPYQLIRRMHEDADEESDDA